MSSVQVDGDSEFMQEFETARRDAGIPLSSHPAAPTVTAASSAATAPCGRVIWSVHRGDLRRSEPSSGGVSPRPPQRPAPPCPWLVDSGRISAQDLPRCLNEKIPQCPEPVHLLDKAKRQFHTQIPTVPHTPMNHATDQAANAEHGQPSAERRHVGLAWPR